jgi:hypothetical protein
VEQEIAAAAAQRDYTVWGLIMQADPVVKGVMLLLVLASVACWAIIFEKLVRIAWLKGAIRRLTGPSMTVLRYAPSNCFPWQSKP